MLTFLAIKTITTKESFNKAISFSFATLTIIGYSDVLPVSLGAKILINPEAIIGQLYPLILIAILVGDYLAQRKK